MTLAEKLADLKAELVSAKTDEERTAILVKIDDVIADATKVTDALKKANKEAKDSREKATALQLKLDADADDEEEEEDEPEAEKGKKKVKKVKKTDDAPPAWAKTLMDKVDRMENSEKSEKVSAMVLESLKERNLPVGLAKFITATEADPEKIKLSIDELEQTIKDDELIQLVDPLQGSKHDLADKGIEEYAKAKNSGDEGTGLSGKKIEIVE